MLLNQLKFFIAFKLTNLHQNLMVLDIKINTNILLVVFGTYNFLLTIIIDQYNHMYRETHTYP